MKKMDVIYTLVLAVYIVIMYMVARLVLQKMFGTPTEVKVVDCHPCYEYYEVIVEDAKGEQWAYYDDEYMEIGTEINATFDGEAIVEAEAKGEN